MASALKHPFLCAGMTAVEDGMLQDFMYINCIRSLDNAVAGAKLAYPKVAEHMADYQADLQRGKALILDCARQLNCQIFDWDYDSMTQNGREVLESVHAFIGTEVPDAYFEKALSLYDESMRHFGDGAPLP